MWDKTLGGAALLCASLLSACTLTASERAALDPEQQAALDELFGDTPIPSAEADDGSGAPIEDPAVATRRWPGPCVAQSRHIETGELGSRRERSYDEEGRPVSERRYHADGELSSVEEWSYDNEGRLIRRSFDQDADGLPDSTVRWNYDAEGREVSHRSYQRHGGEREDRTHHSRNRYDDDGRLVESAWSEEVDGEERAFRRWHHYDEAGRETGWDHDTDDDGDIDQRARHSLDASGRPVRTDFDDDLDGVPDRRIYREYDENGHLAAERVHNILVDGEDASPTGLLEYQHDAEGRLRWRKETLFRRDGSLLQSHAYTFDEHGNWLSFESDGDGDGELDYVSVAVRDAEGREVLTEYDYDADGEPDSQYRNYYDSAGNLLRRTENADGQGPPDRAIDYSYDCHLEEAAPPIE